MSYSYQALEAENESLRARYTQAARIIGRTAILVDDIISGTMHEGDAAALKEQINKFYQR